MKKLLSAFTLPQYFMMVVVYLIVNRVIYSIQDYYWNYLI